MSDPRRSYRAVLRRSNPTKIVDDLVPLERALVRRCGGRTAAAELVQRLMDYLLTRTDKRQPLPPEGEGFLGALRETRGFEGAQILVAALAERLPTRQLSLL